MMFIQKQKILHKRSLLTVILMFFGLILSQDALSKAEEPSEVQFEFSQDDTGYSFRGEFLTQGTTNFLIHVLYGFEHQEGIVPTADSIILLRQGDNWYDVRYSYSGLFFNRKATYRQTLREEEQKITFELIANEQEGWFLPEVLASNGYYKVRQEKNGCRVEYFQNVRIGSQVAEGVYIYKVKSEAVEFIKGLKKYLEKIRR